MWSCASVAATTRPGAQPERIGKWVCGDPRFCKTLGAYPMIDIAYQGLATGWTLIGGTRKVAAAVSSVLIAASCSKNLGFYRERTGILMALSRTTSAQKVEPGHAGLFSTARIQLPARSSVLHRHTILNDDALPRLDGQNSKNIRNTMRACAPNSQASFSVCLLGPLLSRANTRHFLAALGPTSEWSTSCAKTRHLYGEATAA